MMGSTTRSTPTMPPTKAFTSTRSRNCPAFGRSPSWIWGAEALLAGSTAIGSGFQFRHIDIHRRPTLVEAGDLLVIGRCRRQSGKQSGYEDILGEQHVIQAREHVIQRSRPGNAVESARLAGVSR